MAYRRGLLDGTEFNELQERLLLSIIVQEQEEQFDTQEAEFEKELMIHRPEVWQKIQEEREEAEEMGLDEIVWKSPESIDEFEEIEKILNLQINESEIVSETIVPSNPLLNTIDLDELGD